MQQGIEMMTWIKLRLDSRYQYSCVDSRSSKLDGSQRESWWNWLQYFWGWNKMKEWQHQILGTKSFIHAKLFSPCAHSTFALLHEELLCAYYDRRVSCRYRKHPTMIKVSLTNRKSRERFCIPGRVNQQICRLREQIRHFRDVDSDRYDWVMERPWWTWDSMSWNPITMSWKRLPY